MFFISYHMQQHKYFVGILVFLIVVLAFSSYVLFSGDGGRVSQEPYTADSSREEQGEEELVSVSLAADGTVYDVSVPEGNSVYDVMTIASKETDFRFSGKESESFGFFVEEIMEISSDPATGTYWTYYVNGEMAQVGVSDYIVRVGDMIEWKYEKSTF